MKFNRSTLSPSLINAVATDKTASSNRRVLVKKREAPLPTTVSVPYCAWAGDFKQVEKRPYLQIIKTPNNSTLAAVMRDPHASADLNKPSECVARVYQAKVPHDPFILELPALYGNNSIVQPDAPIDVDKLAQHGFSTALIAFESTATPAPRVSFVYDSDGESYIARDLVDEQNIFLRFWAASPHAATDSKKAARFREKGTPFSRTLVGRRDLAETSTASQATYTVKVIENQYFSGQPFLDFDEIMATQTPFSTSPMPTVQTSQAPAPALALASALAPAPTSFIQANVVFELKGANQNVALGFANWGAVVGFAALGTVALLGFAAMYRKTRAASRAPAAQPTPAPDAEQEVAVV